MKTTVPVACAIAILVATTVRSQDAQAPLAAAAAAIGAGNVRSLQFSGWGSDYIFGQAYDGSSPWPRFNVPAMTVAIDYTTMTLRDERRRAQAENPPLGGGFQPLTGELRQIRYVINSHSHFDHAGGLRTYAAEGATVVTHAGNIAYYQQAWANPRTINPDRLAKSGRAPVFEGIVGSRTFRDDARELVVYHYAGNMHNAGMLMVSLPKDRILIEADSFTPPANPNEPPSAIANLAHFCDAVDRLGLDVEQLVPIHGRLTTMIEARAVADRFKGTQVFR
jgi:hypothetical protein